MFKRYKDLLRPLVASLRATLAGTANADGVWQRGDLDRELERLGIGPDGSVAPIANFDRAESRARAAAEAYIGAAVNGMKGAEAEQKRRAAREEVVERAAYTWINRLLALRAMEARGLIDETLRTNPEYDGLSEALYALRQEAPQRCGGADGGWWAVVEDACQSQGIALPGLFDQRDPSAALRPSTPALLRCISIVGNAPNGFSLEEADAAFADPDAVGWAYQFYQEAAKARVYAKLGSGGKAATRAEIAAATQLFTEPYMVQWLLQNSLGRSYHEAYPDSKLPETWAYAIRQRPEGQAAPEHPRPLEALDLIDPCCGSGHFLREAFDMFVAMYRERHPEMGATQIADRVLERHLHGVDLDPRAAQLTALVLYLRAWELVKDEARRNRRAASSVVYRPSALNIATTPSGLSAGALQRHLRRHPEDRVMKPLLEGVFAALEQADILGSLLRPAEHIDTAIKALQKPHTIQMDFDADDAALRRTITTLANSDPPELKRMLLDRVAQSFRAEAGDADDVAASLFGREAEGGVHLLQLLDRKYAVVVTNPPYMGSGNMEMSLKKYIERYYRAGRRDLYAAFILCCLDLCRVDGHIAMVTQQHWMFLRSFADLRVISNTPRSSASKSAGFSGVLLEVTIEALVQLGRYAFSEIGNAVVAPLLLVLRNKPAQENHQIWGCRLVAPRPAHEQATRLADASNRGRIRGTTHIALQAALLAIPSSPIAYWLPGSILKLLQSEQTLDSVFLIKTGLQTSDNERFLRYHWEVPIHKLRGRRWFPYVKGGGFRRWYGLNFYFVDYQSDGARLLSYINPQTSEPFSNIRMLQETKKLFFQEGLTWTDFAAGSMGVRKLPSGYVFGDKGPSIFANNSETAGLAALLNTRLATFILRILSPNLQFQRGYVASFPYPNQLKPSRLISCEELAFASSNFRASEDYYNAKS